ncbi:MAG: hypothetical protein U0936_20310 [Planctomycetaceae bacterium]
MVPPTEATDATATAPAVTTGEPAIPRAGLAQLIDLHEIKTLNDVFAQLKDYGFFVADFTPAGVRNAEPIYPFILERDDDLVKLTAFQGDLLAELRRLGEKGLTLTRFKGLGGNELGRTLDTSMDPENERCCRFAWKTQPRPMKSSGVLMRVTLLNYRREFIEKHALDERTGYSTLRKNLTGGQVGILARRILCSLRGRCANC